MSEYAVRVEGLTKRFGATVALDGVDFAIPAGTVLGLLGPNGAGKTTAVRVLTTLLRPDAGRAEVAPRRRVRAAGGAAVDRALGAVRRGGREPHRLREPLHGGQALRAAPGGRARGPASCSGGSSSPRRPSARPRPTPGGMRRRLDLAGALVAGPAVVVLDEPTTGLDPRGRLDTWAMISELVTDGATVLLTTQYLEEADQLADTIVVIDRGRVIAQGTADSLKDQIGGERLQLVVAQGENLGVARAVLAEVGAGEPVVDEHLRRVAVPVSAGTKALIEALRRFDAEGVEVLDVGLLRPTLDDVFLTLTGQVAEEEPAAEPARRKGRRRAG